MSKIHCGHTPSCGEHIIVVKYSICVAEEVKVVGSPGKNTSGLGPDPESPAYIGVGCHTRGEEIVSTNLSEGCCVNLCLKFFPFVVAGARGKLIRANNAEISRNALVTTVDGADRHKLPVCEGSEDTGIKSTGPLGKAKNLGSRESLPGAIGCESPEDHVGGTCDGPKSKVR